MIIALLQYWLVFETCWWLCLKLRLPPVILMRANFAITFLFALIAINLSTLVIDKLRLLGFPLTQTVRWVNMDVTVIMKILMFFNPHITLHYNAAAQKLLDVETVKRPAIFCANHCSFVESQTLFALCSPWLTAHSKGFYKSDLAKLPLWGAYYLRADQFPVYFKDGDSFSTDREKQAQVQERVKNFLKEEHGILTLFPEGQLNRGDPTQVQPIRHGSMRMAIENGLPFYIFCQYNTWVTWPLKASLGGIPADIFYDAALFELPKEVLPYVGKPGEEIPKDVVEKLANMLQAKMQEMMDQLKEQDEELKKKK